MLHTMPCSIARSHLLAIVFSVKVKMDEGFTCLVELNEFVLFAVARG